MGLSASVKAPLPDCSCMHPSNWTPQNPFMYFMSGMAVNEMGSSDWAEVVPGTNNQTMGQLALETRCVLGRGRAWQGGEGSSLLEGAVLHAVFQRMPLGAVMERALILDLNPIHPAPLYPTPPYPQRLPRFVRLRLDLHLCLGPGILPHQLWWVGGRWCGPIQHPPCPPAFHPPAKPGPYPTPPQLAVPQPPLP